MSKRAPESCPNCFDETDCSHVTICNAIGEAYRSPMAEDMIERVAKRLWDHSFDRMPDPPWEQTSELQKRFNRMLARETIAAMREPTAEMLTFSSFKSADDLYRYQAMIDAALDHKQTGERS